MIIKATRDHLSDIIILNEKIANYMQSNGFNHWGEYPNESIYRRDILRGSQYVYLQNNKVIGMVSYDINHHEYFDKISWNESNLTAYFAHRLAVSPEFQNKGIAHKLMEFVESKARKDGIDAIRLGAFKEYEKVIKFYSKRGYNIMGEIVFDVSPIPFVGMEKSLY